MGEVRAQVIASNPLAPDSPELELDACIDTSAVVVVLIGHDIADRLGLIDMGKAVVTLASFVVNAGTAPVCRKWLLPTVSASLVDSASDTLNCLANCPQ